MKRNLFLLLPGILATTLFFSSCATPSGSYGGAGMRNATDEFSPSTSSRAPLPGERPGLATGWGTEKESRVEGVAFTRASSGPAGMDAIFYNDKEGIKAMSRYPSSTNPMQTAAGGVVEWGVKGSFGYLPAYKEWGYGRRLIAGEKNQSYEIVVKNRCKSPLEIVASVDGLDVMDGKTASFSKRGYIVAPGKTLTIDGFRTSDSAIATFRFSGVNQSYANLKHGDTRNVGVIGIAVFTQKGVNPWKWMPDEIQTRGKARAFAEAPGTPKP
jgi:hypothetical protein